MRTLHCLRKLFLECRILLVFRLHRVDTLDQSGKHCLAYGICSSNSAMKSLGASKGEIMAKRSFFAIVCVVLSIHATAWGQGPGYGPQGPYGPPAGPWAGVAPAVRSRRCRCSRGPMQPGPMQAGPAMQPARAAEAVATGDPCLSWQPGHSVLGVLRRFPLSCGRGARTWPTASSSTGRPTRLPPRLLRSR